MASASWCPYLVELRGLEPLTPGLQSRCSPKLSYSPKLANRLPVLAPAQDFFVRSERPRRPEVRATKVARSVGTRR